MYIGCSNSSFPVVMETNPSLFVSGDNGELCYLSVLNACFFLSSGQGVRSFHATANGTCVSLYWTLLSEQPLLVSFVIEWLELNGDLGQGTGRVEWIKVPSYTRDFQLCRKFVILRCYSVPCSGKSFIL